MGEILSTPFVLLITCKVFAPHPVTLLETDLKYIDVQNMVFFFNSEK